MIVTFLNRPELILIDFLKSFFSHEKLWANIPNQFRYTNGRDLNTLTIGFSEDEEIVNSMPSIVIQESGFIESSRFVGDRSSNTMHTLDLEYLKVSFVHTFVIHCIAETKGASKWLQATCASALAKFRKALYSRGIDNIGPINGMAPQKLGGESLPISYDCPISFTVSTEENWFFQREGAIQESVAINLKAILDEYFEMEILKNGL